MGKKIVTVGNDLLKKIKNGNVSVDAAAVQLCYQARKYSKNNTVKIKVNIDDSYLKIKELLKQYQDDEIDENNLRNSIDEITNAAQKNAEYHYNIRNNINKTSNFSDDITVEYDEDSIVEMTNNCSEINTLEGITIDVPGPMKKHAGNVEAAMADISDISSFTTNLVKAFWQALNIGEECDIDSDTGEMTFDDIVKNINEYHIKNEKSKAIPIDEDFFNNSKYFRKLGGKIENGIATLQLDSSTLCSYNLNTHEFYINGEPAFKAKNGDTVSHVEIYVPSEADDYSKLNTYTFFVSTSDSKYDKDQKHNKYLYSELITNGLDENDDRGKNTNAVLIQLEKFGDDQSWQPYYANTATLTKFVNAVAGTQLEDNKCRNIVGGDSIYGAHSLKVAANSEGLYQTVYCINNAVIIDGLNGKSGNKEQMTIEELKKLDGLDLYFINTAGDGNLSHNKNCSGFGAKDPKCRFDESYTYTGIKLACENCPEANVHMIYIPYSVADNGSILTNVDQMSVYKNITDDNGVPFANYTYDENWFAVCDGAYNTHTEGNYVTSDIVKFAKTNQNYFFQ